MELHSSVELMRDFDEWPAGTAGTIVDDEDGVLLVEISGPDGRTLALLDAAPEDVRAIEPPVHAVA